jgi:hypothetical protein
LDITANAHFNSSYLYTASAAASRYQQSSGAHIWYNAPSGTAGAAISFTQAMTLTSGGNLGVGLTGPGARLHTSAPDATIYQLGISGTTRGVRVETNATETRFVGVDQTLVASFQPISIGGSQVVIRTNGTTEVARFNASGNIALGNITSSAWYTSPFIDIGQYGAIGNNSGGGGGFALYANAYEDTSGTYRYKNTYSAALYRTFNAQHQWFIAPSGTAGDAITFTQAMTLNAAGNVGIGTSSPVDTLHLARASGNTVIHMTNATGSALTNGMSLIVGSGGEASIYQRENNYLRFGTNNTERMRLDASGNLGLGFTPSAWVSTSRALQVLSITSLSQQTNGAANMMVNAYEGAANSFNYIIAAPAYRYSQSVNNGHTWHVASSGTAGVAIGFTQAMTLDPSSNLGIGTTSPLAKLHVNGNALVSTFSSGTGSTFAGLSLGILGGSADGGAVRFNPSASFTGDVAQVRGIPTNWGVSSAGALTFLTNGGSDTSPVERMRIDASGNVGIGTNSPAAKLDVAGIDGQGLQFRTATRTIGIGQVSSEAAVYWGSGTVLTFSSAAVERARITTTGNQIAFQPAESAQNTSVTLTVANLQTRIITSNAAVTLTLPTGTDLEGYTTSMATNTSFECVFIATTANAITIAANGNTTVGNLTVSGNTSGTFRFRKTALNTFTVYRVA